MNVADQPVASRASEPRTHDYTRRYWGHDFAITQVFDGGQHIKVAAWGEGVSEGDYLILPNGDATTRYRIGKIKRPVFGPGDQWFADCGFCPRDTDR